MFASGLRNPQGLVATARGEIFVTDQGPKGGDEINLITDGGNYGWPEVTYGTNYGDLVWPIAEEQGRHDGFVRPLFSWVPSVAPSSLTQLGDAIPEWNGDLLAGSLKDQSLHRIRIEDGLVRYVERIRIGQRIRDVVQAPNGDLLLWTDSEEILRLTQLEDASQRAEAVPSNFVSCLECHGLGTSSAAAPTLRSVVGREIAATEFQYSNALARKNGRWTEENLQLFLGSPEQYAPGTSMPITAFPSPSDVDEIIRSLGALGTESPE